MVTWNPKANELFLEAVERQPRESRNAYLDEACGDDAALREQVESLLAASDRAGSFLESPASNDALTTDQSPLTERPGTVIGPYKLLQQIGEGGMGVVFMAEQSEPLQRTVALKIIKPGMDTRQVIARFEAERQAVAMMDLSQLEGQSGTTAFNFTVADQPTKSPTQQAIQLSQMPRPFLLPSVVIHARTTHSLLDYGSRPVTV